MTSTPTITREELLKRAGWNTKAIARFLLKKRRVDGKAAPVQTPKQFPMKRVLEAEASPDWKLWLHEADLERRGTTLGEFAIQNMIAKGHRKLPSAD